MTDPAVFLDRVSRLSPKRLALLALELQTRVEALERPAPEPIAIVGMGCRLPGDVDSPAAFWELLRGGVDAIREIPPDRWDADALFDADPSAPGKIATRWGGLLDGIDRFDPQVFGISPREALSMDPQQRLLLEVSWEALEHAGYAPDRLAESPTGVFVGICNGDYYDLLMDSTPDSVDAYAATGSAHSVASGRLSYVLGLRGPSLSVDTACSSSLVAVHLAMQSLQAGECRVALAGGVNAILSPRTTMALSRAHMMAADGRCKTFDERADGFVRSEGCGVVVLKRLSEAQADGDRILALIRGSAVNQDGRSNGLTAPNGPSQVAVIRAALSSAGVNPADVSYVETHGTGTSLGDPIEVQALGAAYGPGRATAEPLLLGSVKTNLGHLESAAGITGLIKTVLMLQAAVVPPHLHFETPNSHIPWSDLAVKVPTDLMPWAPTSGKRLAGVSSFGFSGTNAHVILEAAPEPGGQVPAASDELPQERAEILALSARDEAALRALVGRYADSLRAMPDVSVASIGYAAARGRARFNQRLSVVSDNRTAMADALAAVAAGVAPADLPEITTSSARSRPRVAMLFTGHGSLYRGAGHDVFETEPVFRAALERCAAIAAGELPAPLLAALYPDDYPAIPQAVGLLETMTYAQPALFALQYALAMLWQAWGVDPAAVMGHSGGEYAAACVAGSLSLEDALRLTLARGRLMDSLPGDGQMATVLASIETVRELLASTRAEGAGEAVVAAINGPSNVAISGMRSAVQNVVAMCADLGIETRALNIPLAAHSPQVEPVLDAFERAASGISPLPPRVTLVSTLTGRPAVAGEFGSARYWREHLRAPVQFAAAMESLHEQGCEIFVEVGPRATLLGMGRASLPNNGAEAAWLPSLRPDRSGRTQLLEAVAGLFCAGHEVDWSAVTGVAPSAPRPVLPTYPFQRESYWPEPHVSPGAPTPTSAHMSLLASGGHPLLGQVLSTPALAANQVAYASELGARRPAWLAEHRVSGTSLLPAPGYVEMARAAAAESLGWGAATITDLQIVEPLIVPDDGTRAVQLVLETGQAESDTASFAVYSSPPQSDGHRAAFWTLHASGTLNAPSAKMAPASLPREALSSRLVEEIDGANLYERMASAGVDLGPTLRGLVRAWRVDGEVLAQIQTPVGLRQERGYQLHPALLDACFHALGAALPSAAADAGYLLVGCESLEVWGPATEQLWSHATLRLPTASATATGPEVLQADIEIYDADGAPVASVGGVLLKRAQQTAGTREAPPSGWFYESSWIDQAARSTRGATENSLPTHRRGAAGQWLIVTDDPASGAELAAAVRKLGDACDLALGSGALSRVAERTWTVNPRAENEMLDLIATVTEPDGVDALRVVYLAGGNDANSAMGAARMVDTARVLLQATLDSVVETRLWLVTCDSQVEGHDPAAASLWGFGRVAALEQPTRWGGLVDWTRAQPTPVAMSRVALEIAQAGDEDQIALRADDRRLVARLVAAAVPPPDRVPPPDHVLSFDPSASYLVTGGLGGLGLKLAEWLVEHGARHLVLVGRTPLPERAQWPTLEASAAASARVAAILALEASGAHVTPLTLDVADRAAVRDLVSRFGDKVPPLRGIFHLASDLSSVPLAELSASALQAMLRPKVDGAWILDELTRGIALDHFVLFSSTAALWGAQHLGHYAAANSFLDALAHQRRAHGLPALAIDWGTWSEMRVTTAEQRESYQQFGLQPMPTNLALRALGDALARPNVAEVAIASVDWGRLKPAYEARRVRPFLALMDDGRQPELASPEVATRQPSLVDQLASIADLDSRRRVVFSHVLAEVARTLRVGRPESIDPETGLFDLGLDSLMAAELTAKLERAVGQPLPSTLVFNYSTVSAIADYLAQNVLSTGVQAALPATESAQAQPSAATGSGAESLDDLSEEELEASLAATLARLG